MTTQRSFSLAVILLAAGKGTRFGSHSSKGLLRLGDQTIVERLLELVSQVLHPQFLLLVAAEDEYSSFKPILQEHDNVALIAGGQTRQQSVYNALLHLSELPEQPTHVLVHDVARALLGAGVLGRTLAAMKQFDAVTTAIPSSDSLKEVSRDLFVANSLQREKCWRIQTPQGFNFELLWNSHLQAKESGLEVTDDAALVEKHAPVKIVEGDELLRKITYPVDLEWCEFVLRNTTIE